jgi:hypothetical protein
MVITVSLAQHSFFSKQPAEAFGFENDNKKLTFLQVIKKDPELNSTFLLPRCYRLSHGAERRHQMLLLELDPRRVGDLGHPLRDATVGSPPARKATAPAISTRTRTRGSASRPCLSSSCKKANERVE